MSRIDRMHQSVHKVQYLLGKSVFQFNNRLSQWKEFTNTNKRREYSSSCTIDNKGIVVAGGWEGSGRSSVEVLNSQSKSIPSKIQKKP